MNFTNWQKGCCVLNGEGVVVFCSLLIILSFFHSESMSRYMWWNTKSTNNPHVPSFQVIIDEQKQLQRKQQHSNEKCGGTNLCTAPACVSGCIGGNYAYECWDQLDACFLCLGGSEDPLGWVSVPNKFVKHLLMQQGMHPMC